VQLTDFLIKQNLSMGAFARLVGTTTATISRIADGSVMPRKTLLLRIHEATGGQVTANDLTGTYCVLACPAVAGADAQQADCHQETNVNDNN